MILLHVITDNENQAFEIVDFLTDEKLILEAAILEKILVRKRTTNGTINSENQIMIMTKTKAILFNHISGLLKQKYMDKMPVLYSLPIINMEREQIEALAKEVAQA